MKHTIEFETLVAEVKTRVREISAQALRELPKSSYILIDVREDSEWAAGRIMGAVHLGRGIIERDIVGAVPDKAAHLVLYCGGGYRSALAADSLQKMGYSHVESLIGGWSGWCANGFEKESAL